MSKKLNCGIDDREGKVADDDREEKRRISILGVQETRQNGSSAKELERGGKL